jgi:hypothetical protein
MQVLFKPNVFINVVPLTALSHILTDLQRKRLSKEMSLIHSL